MRFYSSCVKIRKIIADYERNWQTFERQRANERAIVSSIPSRKIVPNASDYITKVTGDPG